MHPARGMGMALRAPPSLLPPSSPAAARAPARITLGVAAMARKAHSAPMQSILAALRAAMPHITTIVLDEAALLHAPAAAWPRVDALLAFHSRGFPLEKVARETRGGRRGRVFMVNDLEMQEVMRDRVRVCDVLRAAGVPQPRSIVVDRRVGDSALVVGDVLVVRNACGKVVARMEKPFVEKPVNADDHDVYVYYVGGGVRRLFRKRCGRSSELRARDSGAVRSSGSFLYQEYHAPARCVDVKVYAVGGELFHAEERKAPTVDGRVDRTPEGLEVRRATQLSAEEEHSAARVCAAFRQFVLGFDMLRTAAGQSYVIDVNGWSFVKGNPSFAGVAGRMLAQCVEDNVRGQMLTRSSSSVPPLADTPEQNSKGDYACSPCSP